MSFLLMLALILLSGLIYPPNNYDGMTYRLPRLLHWLCEGQWHWVNAVDWRLNNRAAGFEWNFAPWIALLGTDRFVFLLNWVSFLLLPGLLFSVLTQLGVARRVAWWWMWLLPMSYGFVLQAGGSANDLFAAPLVLAAVSFGLRSCVTRKVSDAWLAILAAGTMTSVKATNLPLLLPCALALVRSLPLLWRRKWLTLLVLAWGTLASFLPTAIQNHRFCGDWSGAVLDKTAASPGPVGGIIGNSFLLVHQNLVPPVFPWARQWNAHVPELVPEWVMKPILASFEKNAWGVWEFPMEESAPVGPGTVALLLLGFVLCVVGQSRPKREAKHGLWQWTWLSAPWLSLGVVMMTLAIGSISRVLLPFVGLLIPLLLISPGWESAVRSRLFRGLAYSVAVLSLAVLVVNPARPLWPANAVLRNLPPSPEVERARTVFQVYAQRHDVLAPVRALIPEGESEIGFVTLGDDPEASLWRPFGSRRIHQFRNTDSREAWKEQGIRYVVLSPLGLQEIFRMSADEWLLRYKAEPVGKVHLRWRATAPPGDWWVVRLQE